MLENLTWQENVNFAVFSSVRHSKMLPTLPMKHFSLHLIKNFGTEPIITFLQNHKSFISNSN